MTEREVIETRICIANILGVAPDTVSYFHTEYYNKPHWFFLESEKFNTLLFFSEKPTRDEIREEIKYCEDIISEMEEDQY